MAQQQVAWQSTLLHHLLCQMIYANAHQRAGQWSWLLAAHCVHTASEYDTCKFLSDLWGTVHVQLTNKSEWLPAGTSMQDRVDQLAKHGTWKSWCWGPAQKVFFTQQSFR